MKAENILKNKLLWLAGGLLLFILFPRPFKFAGKFLYKKVLPNLTLIMSVLSMIPATKRAVNYKDITGSVETNVGR